MIRVATQFDPLGTHAVEAAIPGGCCSCCSCCCCLATTVSISAVAAIQASRKAREEAIRPANAALWVGLAGTALFVAALVAGAVASALSAVAPSAPSLTVFGLSTVIVWAALLWAAFHGVGFSHPESRAAAFTLVGAIAFAIEFSVAVSLVATAFPAYLVGAAVVVAVVVTWAARS